MRLRGGQYCPARPLDTWFAQRPFGRLDCLLKPSQEEICFRAPHQELPEIWVLRAETHRHFNVRQRFLRASAGGERHAERVVSLRKARLELDGLAELEDGRVVPTSEGKCPPQGVVVERVLPVDLHGGFG